MLNFLYTKRLSCYNCLACCELFTRWKYIKYFNRLLNKHSFCFIFFTCIAMFPLCAFCYAAVNHYYYFLYFCVVYCIVQCPDYQEIPS